MIYFKIINEQMVFSDCKTIQTNEGVWISNPSAEQIAAAGWQVYVPPVIPPSPILEPDYYQIAEAVKRMLAASAIELSDEEALEVAAIYPTWVSVIGKQVNAGERYWFNEKLYKVVQTHTAQMDWEPDDTPALYTEVSIVEVPDWRAPTGAQDAYNTGDKVKHNGKTWESLIDANVWEPGAVGTESLWREV